MMEIAELVTEAKATTNNNYITENNTQPTKAQPNADNPHS